MEIFFSFSADNQIPHHSFPFILFLIFSHDDPVSGSFWYIEAFIRVILFSVSLMSGTSAIYPTTFTSSIVPNSNQSIKRMLFSFFRS